MDGDLQRLLDEQAIRALVAAYGDGVAALDAGRAAATYVEEGRVAIVGNALAGRAAIEDGMRQSFAAFSLLQLIAHSGVIALAGDEATARWSTLELAVRRDADTLNVIFGRYEDRLVRTSAGWRFAERRFTLAGRTQLATTKLQLNPEWLANAVESPA